MAESVEKYVSKTPVDDVEGIVKHIKCIITLMEPLVETKDWCEEAALMYQILAEQLSNIRTTLNKEQIIQLLEEEEED